MYPRTRSAVALGVAVLLSACTVHKTEVPTLSGPSGLGTNISITVSPDVLPQDGLSQSLVTITALNNVGQPAANVQLRADIAVGGVFTDFGRLSAKSLVTDGTGRATTTYTAPPAPLVVVGNGTKVDIDVTPIDGNFDNNNPRVASLMLVPPGVVISNSALVPDFTPPSPNAGDVTTLTATVTDPTNSHQVAVAFSWNFGTDAGPGRPSRTFRNTGVNIVTLTITDNLGHLAGVSHPVSVGAATSITPTFFTTPASPVSGQSIIFNASQTQPPAGHTISEYRWDFGDGTDNAFGAVVSHTFAAPGTYTVLLRVTLDNGAQATASQSITVAPPNPKAVINLSPPTGTVGQTITFLGNKSTPAPGRTIVNYTWNFGDGSAVVSGSSSSVPHAYGSKGTFTITLLVTDDQGNQDLATAQITISCGGGKVVRMPEPSHRALTPGRIRRRLRLRRLRRSTAGWGATTKPSKPPSPDCSGIPRTSRRASRSDARSSKPAILIPRANSSRPCCARRPKTSPPPADSRRSTNTSATRRKWIRILRS
jgi:PKD repeat protein